jgi:hypothetical protein
VNILEAMVAKKERAVKLFAKAESEGRMEFSAGMQDEIGRLFAGTT